MKTLEEQFLSLLKESYEGAIDDISNESDSGAFKETMDAKVRKIQAKNCAIFCRTKITINGSECYSSSIFLKFIYSDII